MQTHQYTLTTASVLTFILTVFLTNPASATNTGGVFGPVVNDNHRSTQYRIAYDEETEALAHRLHYQQSVNDDLMWRGVVQQRKPDGQSTDFDYFQAELFWQLKDVNNGWKQGLRFDARLRDGDRPNQVGINYMHDFIIDDKWSARALFLTVKQFGSNARSGIIVETRGAIHYRATPKTQVALSLFSNYGSTSDLAGFDDQTHQIGPTFSFNFDGGWQLVAGYLAGVTDRTPDHNVRLWLTKSH